MNSVMKIFNTLSGKKEELSTLIPNKLSIYVCGITPYDTTHMGHAFTYISFDLLIRFLKYKGYKINYTQNVTDINDRDSDILKRAKEENKTWQDLTTFWTSKFLKDMDYLNWIKPTNFLYASKQINNMIPLIENLLEKNKAYRVNESIYLDIKRADNFGKLSKLNKKDMLEIAKDFEEDVENPDKRQPLDITLWKRKSEDQAEHIPFFQSPYGLGRPGWHLECSAMAISSLGKQIDIHGGGKDLIYPHHESEIAQSEGATGKIPFSKYWLHTGQVGYQGNKMSKSLGNLVMISSISDKYSANSIRHMLLSNHYRRDWEYTEELIKNSDLKMKQIEEKIKKNSKGKDITGQLEDLITDDLNMPKALGLISKNLNSLDSISLKFFLEALGFVF